MTNYYIVFSDDLYIIFPVFNPKVRPWIVVVGIFHRKACKDGILFDVLLLSLYFAESGKGVKAQHIEFGIGRLCYKYSVIVHFFTFCEINAFINQPNSIIHVAEKTTQMCLIGS